MSESNLEKFEETASSIIAYTIIIGTIAAMFTIINPLISILIVVCAIFIRIGGK